MRRLLEDNGESIGDMILLEIHPGPELGDEMVIGRDGESTGDVMLMELEPEPELGDEMVIGRDGESTGDVILMELEPEPELGDKMVIGRDGAIAIETSGKDKLTGTSFAGQDNELFVVRFDA